jgi:hypothetical protein
VVGEPDLKRDWIQGYKKEKLLEALNVTCSRNSGEGTIRKSE